MTPRHHLDHSHPHANNEAIIAELALGLASWIQRSSYLKTERVPFIA
jgi:hypothetical protein